MSPDPPETFAERLIAKRSANRSPQQRKHDMETDYGLPPLLTADETANLLRTTRKAVYLMVERRQLPGVTRVGRRVLFRRDDLLDWLDQKRAPSPKE